MIYLCETCGKWGGLALAFAQSFENLGKSLKGEKVEPSSEVSCPDGHGPMRQIEESVRLQVRAE
jgi:hypothetical protein